LLLQITLHLPILKKLTFKEQRELETIEKEMPELENQRAKILDQLNNEADYEKIAKLSSELETVSEKLENHEMRWLELQEIL
jgi:ATP-binding cassette subfamily F protein uup